MLLALYLETLGYRRSSCAKLHRKVKKMHESTKSDVVNCFKRFEGSDDFACIESVLFAALPEKHRLKCLSHLYSGFIRDNSLCQNLTRAVEASEVKGFESALCKSFSREHYGVNKYVTLSPRGGIYVVRRGALRVTVKGADVCTLTRGAMIEVCVLSERFVTIHESGSQENDSLFSDDGARFEISEEETGEEGKDDQESSDSECDDSATEVDEELSEELPKKHMLKSRRSSLVNALKFTVRNRTDSQQSSSSSRPRSVSIQTPKKLVSYPIHSVSFCAGTEQVQVATSFLFGCELGVIPSDSFRNIVAEYPGVSRNFETVSVALDLQIEGEEVVQRQILEDSRKKLELERKIATNGELELACRNGLLQRAREAIDAGGSISEPLDPITGVTALHIAAIFGHSKIIQLLLERNVDLKQLDCEGRSVLHLCSLVPSWNESNLLSILDLVATKDLLSLRDKSGNSPLHVAAITGDPVMLKLLMAIINRHEKNEELTHMKNQEGSTPLQVCTSQEARRFLKPKANSVGNCR